jgi:hypothetical protein
MRDFNKQATKLSFPEVFASHSALMDVHHMADGTIALVHFDQTITPAGNISATIYLTLIAKNRASACIDQSVPASRDAQPAITFRGDTLFVLDQVIAIPQPVTRLTGYTISGKPCMWTPLPGPGVRGSLGASPS